MFPSSLMKFYQVGDRRSGSDTSTPELGEIVSSEPAPDGYMARPSRFVVPGVAHHVTQRGNYRQKVFYRDEDRQFYLQLLNRFARHYGVALLGYCLMPTHVHLIAVPQNSTALSRTLQRVHGDYARALHLRLQRVGHLWQARYASVALDEKHFWAALVYVEQNPVRAALVRDPAEWRWSSARCHLGMVEDSVLDLEEWRSRYGSAAWKRVLEIGLEDAALEERIREATAKGWPLGDAGFVERLEDALERPARPRRPGPRSERDKWLGSGLLQTAG